MMRLSRQTWTTAVPNDIEKHCDNPLTNYLLGLLEPEELACVIRNFLLAESNVQRPIKAIEKQVDEAMVAYARCR